MSGIRHNSVALQSSALAESKSEPGWAEGAGVETAVSRHLQEPCPNCQRTDVRHWLSAPDRLHGRREKYTLVRCPGCSLVWLSHPPKPEEMHLHYTDAYDKLISAGGDNPARWGFRKEMIARFKNSGALLDLGCSAGAFLELMRSASWKLYGVEMSAQAAKTAETRTGAHVFVGNVLEAQFPANSFDVITCFDVLEHLYEPTRVMSRVAEWLKPGGIFYVLVPNVDSAEARVFGSYWHGLELPRHLFHYSPKSLKALAESVGFQEVSLVTRRNPAVGTSLRYVWDDVFRAVGIHQTPVVYRGKASLPWRAARKVVRMTLLRALLAMAPLVGGASLSMPFSRKALNPRRVRPISLQVTRRVRMNLVDALEQLKQPLAEDAQPLKVFLGCGFTPLHLATFLVAHLRRICPDRRVEVNYGLFGDLIGNLEQLRAEEHDALAVVIEWADLDPRLGLRTLGGWQVEKLADIVSSASRSLDRLSRVMSRISSSLPTCLCMPTLPLPPLFYTGTRQSSIFELNLRRNLASFAETLSTAGRVTIVSEQQINLKSPLDGRFNLRTEITQGFPYKTSHAAVIGELLAEIIPSRTPKKGLITDLDDTLWAGILGDVGVEGIHWHLEQHSQLHGIYQQFLASLASAGILIAAASKNDAALVGKAFERNDLLLPKDSIFPIEAHWGRKSESVRRILKTWNVLEDSVVFVDDSPMEVAEVQAAFPQMESIVFPKDDYTGFWDLLQHLRSSFAKAAVSEEDSLRLQSIRASESISRPIGEESDSTDDFLQESAGCLTLTLSKEPEDTRALELVNKTNQFNLNGIRYDETAWSKFLMDPHTTMITVSYEDRFGRLGRIAVLLGRAESGRFHVETWVMSCRAFSRRIEFHCLQFLFEKFGVDEIHLEVKETGRNSPLLEFLRRFSDGTAESGMKISRSRFFSNAPKMPHKVIERVLVNG